VSVDNLFHRRSFWVLSQKGCGGPPQDRGKLKAFKQIKMHLAIKCPEAADNLNAFLEHFPNSSTLESPDAIRDHIVERISEKNDEWQPKAFISASTMSCRHFGNPNVS